VTTVSDGRLSGFDRLVWLRDRRRLFVAASLDALGLLLVLGPGHELLRR
jgi:hypothetical protein